MQPKVFLEEASGQNVEDAEKDTGRLNPSDRQFLGDHEGFAEVVMMGMVRGAKRWEHLIYGLFPKALLFFP